MSKWLLGLPACHLLFDIFAVQDSSLGENDYIARSTA